MTSCCSLALHITLIKHIRIFGMVSFLLSYCSWKSMKIKKVHYRAIYFMSVGLINDSLTRYAYSNMFSLSYYDEFDPAKCPLAGLCFLQEVEWLLHYQMSLLIWSLFYLSWLTKTAMILCYYTIYIKLSAKGSVSHQTTNCKWTKLLGILV